MRYTTEYVSEENVTRELNLEKREAFLAKDHNAVPLGTVLSENPFRHGPESKDHLPGKGMVNSAMSQRASLN